MTTFAKENILQQSMIIAVPPKCTLLSDSICYTNSSRVRNAIVSVEGAKGGIEKKFQEIFVATGKVKAIANWRSVQTRQESNITIRKTFEPKFHIVEQPTTENNY